MKSILFYLIFSSMLAFVSHTGLWAQPVSLTLTNRDDSGTEIFGGFIFYSGNQYGDVPIWARFGGSGTKSFQIISPGENITRTVTQTGVVFIRPTGDMIIDKSKVINFSGSTANIFGSINVTVRPLTITTYSANVAETTAGSELQFPYYTGSGIYPTQLVTGKFKIQLLTSSGAFIGDMLNSEDLYTPSTERGDYSTGTTRNIKATLPADVAPGTYRARVVTNGLTQQVLGTASSTFVVKSNQATIKITSVNKTSDYCPGRDQFVVSFTVNGAAPSGTTYTVLISDRNGVFQSPNSSQEMDGNILGTGTTSPITCSKTRPIDTYAKGSYKIKVISNNSNVQDDGSSIGVTLTRPDPPSVKTQSYCQSTPIGSFEVGASNLMWYGIFTNGTRQGWDRKENPPIPTTPGTYSYEVSQIDNSGCTGSIATFTLVVTGKSNRPSIGNAEFCQGETPRQLSTTAQNPLWFDSNDNPLPGPPSPPTNSAGDQFYKVSQLEGSNCRSDKATVKVTVKGLPSKPTVPNPDPLCQGGASKALTASSSGSLTWYDPSNTSLGGTAPQPPTSGSTPLTYYVTQTVNGCTSEKTSVTQTFKAAPAKPSVETGKTFCVGQQNIQPLTATGQNLKWYQNNNPLPGAPTPPTDQARTIDYQVSQNDGCESERSTFTVRVLAAPGAPIVSAIGLCQGVTSSSLTATGESLKWYDDATTTTALPGAPAPSTTQAGVRSYFVTQTAGNCEGPRAELKVTINLIPAAPTATPPNSVCETINGPQIIGPFTASGQSLTWYGVGLPPAGSSLPPSSATASPGTFTIAVSQTVLNCPSPRLVITQTINPAPVRPAVSPLLLCLNDVSKALSATALSGHRLNWYGQNITGGSASATAPVVTAEATKNLSYYVSQTNETTSCESPRQSLTVIVANKPNAPELLTSQFACLGTPAKALVAKGNDLLWTASNGGGLTSPTSPPIPPTTVAATYSYTVVDRLGSCTSDPGFVTFTVRPLPSAPVAQATQNACIGSPLSLSATGSALKWYSSQSDADSKLNPRSQVSIPTSGASAQTWYVTQSDGNGCESPYVPVLARILSQATARLVGDGYIYSTDSSAIRIYFGGEGPWTLTFLDGEKTRTFTRTQENPLIVWVRLPKSISTDIGKTQKLSYSLGSLSNDCGSGVLPTPYELTYNLVTAIDPGIEGVAVSAYPNPISGFIRVDWSAAPRKAITLRIVSVTGHILWQNDRIGTGALQSEYVDTSFFPGGLYVLQLQSAGGSVAERRIIKQ